MMLKEKDTTQKDNSKVEKDYSDFLDSCKADRIFGNFSDALREAYFAGYKAAGGNVSQMNKSVNKIIHIKFNDDEPNN